MWGHLVRQLKFGWFRSCNWKIIPSTAANLVFLHFGFVLLRVVGHLRLYLPNSRTLKDSVLSHTWLWVYILVHCSSEVNVHASLSFVCHVFDMRLKGNSDRAPTDLMQPSWLSLTCLFYALLPASRNVAHIMGSCTALQSDWKCIQILCIEGNGLISWQFISCINRSEKWLSNTPHCLHCYWYILLGVPENWISSDRLTRCVRFPSPQHLAHSQITLWVCVTAHAAERAAGQTACQSELASVINITAGTGAKVGKQWQVF